MRRSSKPVAVCASLVALTALSSCDAPAAPPAAESPTQATISQAPPPPPPRPAPAAPHTKNWFDLNVGDCLTEVPAIDIGVVTTTVVDCAAPHQAEVYLLAPLKVNAAVDEVANDRCAQGFVAYTGQAVNGSPYLVSFLIDSNQDRTANNPTPSTAICFLQAANGAALTKSARA
jgi:hypothetical protein